MAGCQDPIQPTKATEVTENGTSLKIGPLQITVVDLGFTGYPTAISPQGEVTGTDFALGPGKARPFVWKDGQLTYLDEPGNDGRAEDINPAGIVVGQRNATYRAVMWKQGSVTDLGVLPGDDYSYALGINAAGRVVGYSGNGDVGSQRGFLWEKGVMTELATPPDFPYAEPDDINPSGQIVGNATNGPSNRAFLWEDGNVIDLGTLPGYTDALASAINPAGQVVGYNATEDWQVLHAVLWDSGTIRDLGTLEGYSWSVAVGINSAGQVVGWSSSGSSSRATLWDHGAMYDLGTLPGTTGSLATAINDSGQIVGLSGSHVVLWRVR